MQMQLAYTPIYSTSNRFHLIVCGHLTAQPTTKMKFQVFLVLALVALALAKKDKIKKDKSEEPKPADDPKPEGDPKPEDDPKPADDPKPEEDLKPLEDKVIEVIADKPRDIKVGKLSVMDWESTYGSRPVEILRSFKLGDMPYMYDRGFYPGYQYPRIIGSPYRRLIFNPEQYYNHFGYYPTA